MRSRPPDPLRAPTTPEDIHQALDQYARSEGAAIRGALIWARATDDAFPEVAKRRVDVIDEIWRTSFGRCLFLQEKHVHRGEEYDVGGRVALLETSVPGVSLLLTPEKALYMNELVGPLVAHARPRIAFPYVTSRFLQALLRQLAALPGQADFKVEEIVGRTQLGSKDEGGKTRSERVWTREPVDQALNLVHERQVSLQAVEFQYAVMRDGGTSLYSGKLSRRSIFRASGEWSWFREHVLAALLREASQVLEFFAKRGRAEAPRNAPRPLVIEYAEPVFREKAQNHRLIRALQSLGQASVSVLHRNPYIRLSIVDFGDGSSYEVLVLEDNRIIITPQFRATFPSLERLVHHVLTRFGEGALKDFVAT